jgi:hypothetical protein
MAHFAIDGGLWRMRDRFPRSFLAARLPYLLPGVQPSVPPAARPGVQQGARPGASAPVPSAGDIR